MTLIPDSALKKHIAILGTNGSGKTSVAKVVVMEPALAAGERVCSIDPTGVAWGLRLGANGKPKGGFTIYIVGGEHADFPLTRRDGAAWADIVGTSSDSFVFDTSLMTVADRTAWFTAFAETLIRKNKGPLRLIIDEAHLFAPQGGAKAGGLAPDMLHAANNLLALGRSKGLRITMISQRPAKLHKDALTQAHTLVAMKLVAPQDRAAVKDWVGDQTDGERGKEIIASLPTLKPGEAWVWAPAEGILDRMQFPRPSTYDSSRAPDDVDGDGPKLAPIDPAAVQARLQSVAAEAVANDPAALRKRIAELERQAGAKTAAAPVAAVPDQAAIAAAEERGRARGYSQALHDVYRDYAPAFAKVKKASETLSAASADLGDVVIDFAARQATLASQTPAPARPVRARPTSAPRLPARPQPAIAPTNGAGPDLTGPQRHLLRALAWWQAMGHDAPTRIQLAGIAGWKPRGSNLRNRLSELSGMGLIEYPADGLVSLTAAGAAAAPAPNMSDKLVDSVRAMLTGPQRQLFDALFDCHGNRMTRTELAESVNWEPGGSNLRNRLSELSSLELVEYPGPGEVALQPWIAQ